MTKEEALNKLQRYCTYQDRCHSEVRSKLLSLRIYGEQLEEVIASLIQDGYLNEERYSINYARGKYRIKNWGKMKIIRELRRRNISDYCIQKAILEIDREGDYEMRLRDLLTKYVHSRENKYDLHQLSKMAYAHAVRKGFEAKLVGSILKQTLRQ